MKHKFDLNEIESDEQMWELNKFHRDHYILCGILAIALIVVLII